MSEFTWQPHHTIIDGHTTQVDGQLNFGGQTLQLDVLSTNDEYCAADEKPNAQQAWDNGDVFLSQDIERYGVRTLIVPSGTLTQTVLDEAIRRFRP